MIAGAATDKDYRIPTGVVGEFLIQVAEKIPRYIE